MTELVFGSRLCEKKKLTWFLFGIPSSVVSYSRYLKQSLNNKMVSKI